VYIVRFVEAMDEEAAGREALEKFRREPKGIALMERLLNPANDPPIFEADTITEVDSNDLRPNPSASPSIPKRRNKGVCRTAEKRKRILPGTCAQHRIQFAPQNSDP
jgi:hypothetical protein